MIHEAMHPVYFANHWQCRAEDTLLFVGSLAKRKGLETLLAALRQVATHRPQVRLRVIGGGAPPEFERLCANAGVTGLAEFRGFLSAEEIAAEHLRAQIFVLPSDNENSPNSLAEAMVSGLPVIANRVGGIPSMVSDEETGLLVPPRDPAALAAKILSLLTDSAKRARLGEQARIAARARHLPATVADQTLAAYQEILQTEAGLIT
jgi:glycosyltransferase involved in cell wall biosynthesis